VDHHDAGEGSRPGRPGQVSRQCPLARGELDILCLDCHLELLLCHCCTTRANLPHAPLPVCDACYTRTPTFVILILFLVFSRNFVEGVQLVLK